MLRSVASEYCDCAGRARAADSVYTLVAEQGRGAADKEVFNQIRENMMKRAIREIQYERKPEDNRRQIRHFQEMAKVEREMVTRGKQLSERLNPGRRPAVVGVYTLRCQKCDSFAALSKDIRTIESSHRVILDNR